MDKAVRSEDGSGWGSAALVANDEASESDTVGSMVIFASAGAAGKEDPAFDAVGSSASFASAGAAGEEDSTCDAVGSSDSPDSASAAGEVDSASDAVGSSDSPDSAGAGGEEDSMFDAVGSSDSPDSTGAAGDEDSESNAVGSSDSSASTDAAGGVVCIEELAVSTDVLGAATGFASVAGDVLCVAGVAAWTGVCPVGLFVSAWTAVAFVCRKGFTDFVADALDSATDFTCAVAGGTVDVDGDAAWAGDCPVGLFVSAWTAAAFVGRKGFTVFVADASNASVGLACAAAGGIVCVAVFAVTGVGVSAGTCAAGFFVSALSSVCSSPPLGTGSKSSGFKNGFEAEV